jgi:hypothetical protein
VAPDRDISFLSDVGKYILDVKPEVVVCIGDFWDFPSLNSHVGKGSKELEGKRIKQDIAYGVKAMKLLLAPIIEYNKHAKEAHRTRYKPRMIFTIGNHEQRMNRLINECPQLEGMFSLDDLKLEEMGWEVHDFLEIAEVDGICYTHYVANANSPRPLTTAKAIVNAIHKPTIVGHAQILDYHYQPSRQRGGTPLQGIICGACYTSEEPYRGSQNQEFFRGVIRLSGVEDGLFYPMFVGLPFLKKRYGSSGKKK